MGVINMEANVHTGIADFGTWGEDEIIRFCQSCSGAVKRVRRGWESRDITRKTTDGEKERVALSIVDPVCSWDESVLISLSIECRAAIILVRT